MGSRRPSSQIFSMNSGKPDTWSGCSCVTIIASMPAGSMPEASRRCTTSPPQSTTTLRPWLSNASMVVVRDGSLTAAPVPRR
jgi:hypothetical protein